MEDERALVVRPQEHEPTEELEQVLLGEVVDLPVGDGLAVADDAPEIAFRRENLGHRGESIARCAAARAG
jgi:hypothetical protein